MTHSSLPHRASHDESAYSDDGMRPSFSQIMSLILRHWYWFIISCILFVILGKSIVAHRPMGQQTYYMQLSSRQPHELTNPMIPLSDSTDKTSPWTPEYIAALLNTTTAVVEAGQRINFQVDYTVQTPWGKRDYYNQTPILVHFDDLLPTDEITCMAQLDDPVHPQQVTLRAFSGIAHGVKIREPYEVIAPIGIATETPVGRITVQLDDPARHYPYHIDQRYEEIAITYSTLTDVRNFYEKELEVTMKRADLPLSSVIRVDLLTGGSERRSLELLHEMYLVTDSIAWVEQLSDETGVPVAQFAGSVPAAGRSPFRLIDEPRVLSEMQPDLFIIAGLGLFGLLLPLLIMYIYWVILGAIYYVSELPSLLRQRLRLDIQRNRRGKRPLYPNLEELCALVSPEGEPCTIQLATPSRTKSHEQLLTELQQALQQRGISCGVWHLEPASRHKPAPPKEGVYRTQLTPGLVGSADFQQQLKQLQAQHQLLIIAPPALTKAPTAYLLADSVAQSFYCIYRGGTAIRAIGLVVKQLQIRRHIDLSRLHTLWVE